VRNTKDCRTSESSFSAVAARGEAQRKVEPGDHLRQGDRLRFVVDPGTARYLLVLSIDGAGNHSVYFPAGGARSEAIPDRAGELPGSTELDAVTGPERVWAVFSSRPLDAAPLFDRLQSGETAGEGIDAVRELNYLKEAP
jgi:hypothetical protein